MVYENELRMATTSLPRDVRAWVERALRSGWYAIGSGAYNGGGGHVCPIVAAGMMAGLWGPEGLRSDDVAWGTAAGPSDAVEEFAAYFDLYAEERGTGAAVAVVTDELDTLALAVADDGPDIAHANLGHGRLLFTHLHQQAKGVHQPHLFDGATADSQQVGTRDQNGDAARAGDGDV